MARRKDDKSRSRRRHVKEDFSDTESVSNDSLSAASCVSYASSKYDSEESFKEPHVEEETTEVDDFENKLDLVLENINNSKSTKAKCLHFESLAKALSSRYCCDILDNRKISLQESIENGLKRFDDEAGGAALALSLTMITMGTSDYCDEIFRCVYKILHRNFIDSNAKPTVRAKCATALSIGCFITDFGMDKTRELLTELLSFGIAPIKANFGANQINDLCSFKATCLDMFSFLVTVESGSFIVECLNENIENLSLCLESVNLGIRVSAGECLALLFEKSKQFDDDYELESMQDLCHILHSLATDCAKSRSKKVLREQRSNFRQIVRTIEGNSFSKVLIKFGHEHLILDSWQMKRYYDTFCSVIGSGTNLHLYQNILLRNIFNLGPVPLQNLMPSRIQKLETHYVNGVNRKVRKITRGRMRSKRYVCDY